MTPPLILFSNMYKTWPPTSNDSPPDPEMARWFQAELTSIAGIVFGAFPRLRLFWGQEMREADQYPGVVHFHGSDMMRHRYSLRTVQTGWVAHFPEGDQLFPPTFRPPEGIPEGVLVERTTRDDDIGIPRWFVHQWRSHTKNDALTYKDDSTAYDPDTGETLQLMPKTIGPGQWSKVAHIIVSDPTGTCCARAKIHKTKCFHEYREPGQADLDYLAAMWKEIERMPVRFSEGEIAPLRVIEQRTMARLDQIADVKARENASLRLRLKDTFKSARTRLFNMPFVAVPSNYKES